MKYLEFKQRIEAELRRNPAGLTWNEIRDRLDLPYDRPCPTWLKQLEDDIRLSRAKGSGRALVWTIK